MTNNRLFIYSVFLLALPLIIAWYEISVLGAFTLIVLMLLCRWAITLSGLLKPERVPKLQLDTISASHFVEKVRWCMDSLGLKYEERPTAGIMGLFFIGRTVPQLRIRTGFTRSTISNSSDILRYLWGRYGASEPEKAAFLAPTKEHLALEEKIDIYGKNLQLWGYYHILTDKKLALQMWGANCPSLPAWQRKLVVPLFPVLKTLLMKAFQINDKTYKKEGAAITEFLSEMEHRLSEDSVSILSNDNIDFVDIAFSAISGIWLLPDAYGGGKAEGVRISHEDLPTAMKEEIDGWKKSYPKCVAFIDRVYAQRNK